MNYLFNEYYTRKHYLRYYVLLRNTSAALWIFSFLYLFVSFIISTTSGMITNPILQMIGVISITIVFLPGWLIYGTTAIVISHFLKRYNHTTLNISFQKDCIHYVNDTEGDFVIVFGYFMKKMFHKDVIKRVTHIKITKRYMIIYGDIEQQYSHKLYQSQKVKIKRCYDHEEDLINRLKEYM